MYCSYRCSKGKMLCHILRETMPGKIGIQQGDDEESAANAEQPRKDAHEAASQQQKCE